MKQYSDMLKEQEKERETLLDTRFNDIQKCHMNGMAKDELDQLSKHYDVLQKELTEKHEMQRKEFLRVPEMQEQTQGKTPEQPDMTERANELHERIKKKHEQERAERDDRNNR